MDQQIDFKEQVMKAINTGAVSMRPRWYFALIATLVTTGGVALLLSVIYLSSFIIFVLRRNGISVVPAFGAPGWFAFLFSLPWILIGLLIIFIITLEILVRRYAFSYQRPLLFSVSAILVLVIIGGASVAATSFHRRVFGYVERHGVPVARPIYHRFGNEKIRMIHPGIIDVTTTRGFFMRTRRSDAIEIIMTSSTQLPFGADFAPGDTVVVFGDEDGMLVQALGIREVEAE